jgi:hypothetical protein
VTRAAAALVALALAAAPGRAAPAGAKAPQKGPRTGLVRVSYEEPKVAVHDPLYQRLRERRALEPFAGVLGTIRLPRPLTLRFAGCGEANAWYDAEEGTVTFCYELVADIERSASGAAQYGVSREEAFEGPIAFVLLHECAHAIFDLLDVPILGREEDAADQLAAQVLLRAGDAISRRTLRGAAWMYKHDASKRLPDESDFSDVHGLDAQRLYNVLCMAYGSDPESHGEIVEKGYLPKDRADGCPDEYAQVAYAVRKLIWKSVDAKAAERTRASLRRRFGGGERATPAPAPAPAPEKR